MPRILFLTNNPVSSPLIEWLAEKAHVTICAHKITASEVDDIDPHLVVSYSYRHIIRKDVLDTLPGKFINLHISLLPYNRGADPNAWSFIENTPKGVTIHVIEEGLDTDPILIQQEVIFDERRDTLGGSYNKLHQTIQNLFIKNWDDIKDGKLTPTPQVGIGTHHNSKEFLSIKEQLLGTEGWDITIETFKERYQKLMG